MPRVREMMAVKAKPGVFLNYVFLSYAGAGCRLQ
jgi:hypothetical protein